MEDKIREGEIIREDHRHGRQRIEIQRKHYGGLEEVRIKMTEGNTPELRKYLSVQRRAHCLTCKGTKREHTTLLEKGLRFKGNSKSNKCRREEKAVIQKGKIRLSSGVCSSRQGRR